MIDNAKVDEFFDVINAFQPVMGKRPMNTGYESVSSERKLLVSPPISDKSQACTDEC